MVHILVFFYHFAPSPPKINSSSKTGKNRLTEHKNLTISIDKLLTTDRSKRTTTMFRQPITWPNWPIRTIYPELWNTINLMIDSSLWLWRWLPHRLSKYQSLISQSYFWPADDRAFSHPSFSLGTRLDKWIYKEHSAKLHQPERKLSHWDSGHRG